MTEHLEVRVSRKGCVVGWMSVVLFAVCATVAFIYAFTDNENVIERRIGPLGIAAIGVGSVGVCLLFLVAMVRLLRRGGVLILISNGDVTVTTARGLRIVPVSEISNVRYEEKTKSLALVCRGGEILKPMLRPGQGTWDVVAPSVRSACGVDG